MKLHKVCDLFPPMSDGEFRALVEDIRAHGVKVPIETWRGEIIDGRHRWRACEELGIVPPFREWDGAGSLVEYVVGLNLRRRHLTPSQAACVATDMLPLLEAEAAARRAATLKRGDVAPVSVPEKLPERAGEAREHAARIAGTNPHYVQDAKKLKAEAPERFERVRSGETTLNRAMKEHRAEVKAIEKATPPAPLPEKTDDRFRLIHGDFRTADVELNSADWIITDPPYPAEFLDLFAPLGAFAARTLKPGGSLVCMVGQSYLPQIMAALEMSGLTYRWTLAYMTPGGQAVQLWQRKVNTFWKPVLVYTKGAPARDDWLGDVARSNVNDNDKEHHHWGQSESGMADLMRRFVYAGDVIVDPFLGGGTTGLVALDLKCRFVGIDIEEASITTSSARMRS